MSFEQAASFRDEHFAGTGRLFPLPHLVMFPHVVQALYIFEPRYCELLDDALATDSLMTLATSLEDAPAEYCRRIPIAPVTCLTRIISHKSRLDGTRDILVLGVRRARVICELPRTKHYREARLELAPDELPEENDFQRQELLSRLVALANELPAKSAGLDASLALWLQEQQNLSALTDLLSYSMPISQEMKLDLLAEANPVRRAEVLLESVLVTANHDRLSFSGGFPPRFSWN